MSYSDTENEHHETISTAIVHLRNEVAKLTSSAHNMRGQGLACDDPERACALYESSAAYADAAQRVGAVASEFEEAESYRAGAMEAIGPVLSYDELERRLGATTRLEEVARERAQFLETQLGILDAELGGQGRATTEEVVSMAAATAKALRRHRGIRETAISLLDSVRTTPSKDALVTLMTILLDGEEKDRLARYRAAVGADKPVVLSVPPELADQIRRVARKEPFDWAPKLEPLVDQLVAGYDVTDVAGDLIIGRVVHVDADFVNVQLPNFRSDQGWYLTHVALDRTELRVALPHEVNAFTRNLQLAKDENPGLQADERPAPTDLAVIPASQLDDTTPYVGTLENGSPFVGLYVGTTEAGKVKLQRPVKSGTATEDWAVRLEEVNPETVRRADQATAEEFELLVEQSNAEIHGEVSR